MRIAIAYAFILHFQNLLNETVYDSRLVTGLWMNYRALPSILHAYNSMFYNSKLISTVSDEHSKEIKLLNKLSRGGLLPRTNATSAKCGLYFRSVHGKNIKIRPTFSWCNVDEADLVKFRQIFIKLFVIITNKFPIICSLSGNRLCSEIVWSGYFDR